MNGLIGIISAIVLLYAIWQRQELKKFQVTHYKMSTSKVNKKINIVVISDLHSFSYGTDNECLFAAVIKENPDFILIPGDLIVTGKTAKYEIASQFISRLCATKIPVIYSNGNHESKANMPDADCYPVFVQYEKRLQKAGVVNLNNACRKFHVNGEPVCIYGLELPLYSYKKGRKPYLESGYLEKQLGKAPTDCLTVLLAHNPAFARQYAEWGADITVCGHNHGGLIYIPGIGSVLSPQLLPFPKYDAGEFTIAGKKIYISRGLGTHTFHIRICNRAELVVISVNPKK